MTDVNTPAARAVSCERLTWQNRGGIIAWCKKKNGCGMQSTKKLWESRGGEGIVDVEGSEGGVLLGGEGLGQKVSQVDGARDVGNT